MHANISSDKKYRSVENISTQALFFVPFFSLKTPCLISTRIALSVVPSLISFVTFGI